MDGELNISDKSVAKHETIQAPWPLRSRKHNEKYIEYYALQYPPRHSYIKGDIYCPDCLSLY